MKRPDLTTALLAGGESARMGTDKAFLHLPGREAPLYQLQLEKLARLEPRAALLSARPEQDLDVEDMEVHLVPDQDRDLGPLEGLCRCLERCPTPWLLVLAVDLPCMTAAFLERLADRAHEHAIGLVPESAHGVEPLCAVYPKSLYSLARLRLRREQRSLRGLTAEGIEHGLLQAMPLKEEEEVLMTNVNCPRDLEQLTQYFPS